MALHALCVTVATHCDWYWCGHFRERLREKNAQPSSPLEEFSSTLSPEAMFLLFMVSIACCVYNGLCIEACINRKKKELGEGTHVRTEAWATCLLTCLLGSWCCCWIPFVVSLSWLHVLLVSTAIAAH